MSKALYYSPRIKRFLVTVLYHEARLQKVPMMVLTNQLLERTLQGTQGWHQATAQTSWRGEDHVGARGCAGEAIGMNNRIGVANAI